MKFVIESVSKNCGRIGRIEGIKRLPERTYKTPFLLFLFPNLSREVLELTNFDLASDFGVLLPVSSIEQMEKPLKLFQKGISEFIGLKDCFTMITLKNPSENSITGHHEKGSISIMRRSGRLNIKPERYMSIIEVSKADAYTSIADSDVYAGCPKKRVLKSIDRSESMFDDCMNIMKEDPISTPLIASVQGGFNELERKKSIEFLKKFEDTIFGYFLDGLHRNGHEATTIDQSALKEIVKSTVSILPENKLKLMLGCYLPHVILELIGMGIDVFDSSFVNIVTNHNRAIVFNFDLTNPVKTIPEINLMDIKYKDDFTPFAENCDCHACKNHTKAYTNHLLITRELLGPMLLTIHNLHHYKRFFETIRESIKNDKLNDLTALIAEQYKDAIFSYDSEEKDDKSSSKRKLIEKLQFYLRN